MTPETLIAAALRDEISPWPTDTPLGFETRFLEAAADHGVTQLLSSVPALHGWPQQVQSTILQQRRNAAATEVLRQQELTGVLAALADAGVRTLLFKGAALAWTHYAHPWLRPRLDTDLLVAYEDRARATAALESLGYEPSTHFGGELVTYQSPLKRIGRHGLTDRLDLHWRVANPQVFGQMFSFEDLERDAVPIRALGTAARVPSPPHALLLACVHRVAHHANSDRLIWLYDIRLLLDRMSSAELEHVASTAAAKHLQSVLGAGVARASQLVGLKTSAAAIERLVKPTVDDVDGIAAFLKEDRAKVDDLVSDLQSLPGWRPKLRLIREHLLPPAAYMRQAYGVSSPVLLPFAYALRAVTGASRWFRPDR